MDSLIPQAMAAESAPSQGDPLGMFLPLIIIFAIFYFLIIRPQTKRQKEHQKMVAGLESGDEVVTNGGVLGRISEVGEQAVTLEIAEGVEIRVQKNAVAALLPKGTYSKD